MAPQASLTTPTLYSAPASVQQFHSRMPALTSTATASTIATLSYPQARSDPTAFQASLRAALVDAPSSFFYLTDIWDDPVIGPTWLQTWREAFEASEKFFALPAELKDEISMIKSPRFRGWSAVGVETTQGKQDWREQIDFGPDTSPLTAYPPTSRDAPDLFRALYGPNQFPSSVPELKPAITAFREHCQSIAAVILDALAATLLLPGHESNMTRSFETHAGAVDYSRSKTVSYPPSPPGTQGLGVGAHKDGGGLTILAQDDSGGLQVQRSDNGVWCDVEPRGDGVLVINVGQVIERLSRGLCAATTHRVLPTRSDAPKPRLSIPFFLSPSLEAKVEPVPRDSLRPEMLERLEALEREDGDSRRVSEVKKGDLHEREFGRAAWRGISRSHADVWRRWWSEWDSVGGPDRDAVSS